MSKSLRLCSGLIAIRKFERAGWIIDRQVGSHVMIVNEDYRYTLSVPLHKELGIGILRKSINQAELTIEEFNNL